MGDAVRAVYQAQFVNLALPGGVLGDLHRGYSHGRASSSVGLGLRSVVWERTAGQVVQVSATVLLVLLLKLPTGIRRPSGGLVAVGVLAAVLLVVAACSRRLVPLGRLLFADLRRLLSLRVWPIVVATSLLATAGHLVVFIAAARATGVTASLGTLAGLGLTVLLAASIPTSLAGWGPREAVAAWSFTHVGLSAAEGVAATTAYGVLALLATLPGAFLLMRRPHRHAQIREVAHG